MKQRSKAELKRRLIDPLLEEKNVRSDIINLITLSIYKTRVWEHDVLSVEIYRANQTFFLQNILLKIWKITNLTIEKRESIEEPIKEHKAFFFF